MKIDLDLNSNISLVFLFFNKLFLSSCLIICNILRLYVFVITFVFLINMHAGYTAESKHFLSNITKYNSCFQMT